MYGGGRGGDGVEDVEGEGARVNDECGEDDGAGRG